MVDSSGKARHPLVLRNRDRNNEITLKVATRVLDEEYFLDAFLNHYVKHGADEIHIFDSGSSDGTLRTIQSWQSKTDSVKLIQLDDRFRHTSRSQQTFVCNHVLKRAIRDSSHCNEECWWIFPDVDEFLRSPCGNMKDFLRVCSNDVVRCVFIDWYLPPDLARGNLTAQETLSLMFSGKLRGRMLDLWRDPFYKDYVIRLTPQERQFLKEISTVSGFHRFVLKDRVLVPPNEPHLVVDHLRGVPLNVNLKRIKSRLFLLREQQDDWSLQHFTKLERQLKDYEMFWNGGGLLMFAELERERRRVKNFDNRKSFFNNVIMSEDLRLPEGSKPSMHELGKSSSKWDRQNRGIILP